MALLWVEGFEGIASVFSSELTTQLQLKYATGTYNNLALQTGRFGTGKALSMGSSAGSGELQAEITPGDTFFAGYAFKFGELPALSPRVFLSFYDGANRQIGLWVDIAGFLFVGRGPTPTSLERYETPITRNRWYFVEIKVVIGNSGSYEVRLDGVTIMSATGVDTDNMNTGQATRFAIGFPRVDTAGKQIHVDDVYCCDDTGSVNNTFLGDIKISGIFPVSDNTVQLTPLSGVVNYAMVNEIQVDNNTTYVSSATNGHQDLYNYGDVSGFTDVKGLQINTVALQSASENLKTVIKSGATVSSDVAQALSASYLNKVRISEEDPNAVAPWTETTVNALVAGVEVSV